MMGPDPTNGDGTLSWTVHEDDGTVLDEGSQPIDSYVVQWAEGLAATLGEQDVSGVTDTGGTDRDLQDGFSAEPSLGMGAGSGDQGFGLVVGADGTAESITDNSLGSQLTSDMSYGAMSVGSGSVSGSSAFLDLTRTFGNNTGSAVDVNEAGLVYAHELASGGDDQFLGLRDTGSPIVSIPDGQNATLEYTLEYTV